jgi:HEAT repeats
MAPQKTTQSLPLPKSMQDLIIAFMQAVKAGRLYSSGHTLFKQSVKRLQERLQEAREDRDFLFVGFARESLLLSDEFFQVSDVHGRDFLNLFHSLGISHLLIHKEATLQELESFVETLSGAKAGQGQEVLTALHRENISRINLGLLDYSVFTALDSVVTRFVQGREAAAIWRQLILRPAMAGVFHLDSEQVKQILRLSDDPESLRHALAELDGNLKRHVQSISPAQRGQIIGNFLQNISKALARIDSGKRRIFKEAVAVLLGSIRPEMRIPILGSASPELIEGEDGGVVRDLIEDMPEQELVHLITEALSHGGAQALPFNNLLRTALARFGSAGPLLDLVREEMHRVTQERRPGTLNLWQHLEQILLHHQESEDFNAQYRKAIEDLSTSLKLQKAVVEEEEMGRLVRTIAPDSLKLFKARLIVDLLQETQRSEPMTLPLLQAMGETVQHFLNQERPRFAANLLRQVLLSMGRVPENDILVQKLNTWLSAEDVQNLLKSLLEKCRTYEPPEMSAINAVCQLYPEKAGGFLIDLYIRDGDREGPTRDWLTTTLAGIASHLASLLSSRMGSASDAALPALIELADLFADQQIAPALERLLDHNDYDIRSQAVRILGRLKSPKSVEPLARVVLERSWFAGKKMKALKMEALQALAEIQTREAVALIERIASTGSGSLQKLSRELLETS